MSTHYESLPLAQDYQDAFAVPPPEAPGLRDMWPRKPGWCIRAESTAVAAVDDGATAPAPARALVPAQWGLVPHWVKSESDGRLRAAKLVEARSETATTSTLRGNTSAGCRIAARTEYPSPASSVTSARPTNPDAPVTRMRVMICPARSDRATSRPACCRHRMQPRC